MIEVAPVPVYVSGTVNETSCHPDQEEYCVVVLESICANRLLPA